MMEQTKAEKLAYTLRYLVGQGLVPGLLPKDVLAAADLLETQEKDLVQANTALAAKEHIVQATASEEDYKTRLAADFIITDPRIYHGELVVDTFMLHNSPNDFLPHAARSLARSATHQWQRDIEEKTAIAFYHALQAMRKEAA